MCIASYKWSPDYRKPSLNGYYLHLPDTIHTHKCASIIYNQFLLLKSHAKCTLFKSKHLACLTMKLSRQSRNRNTKLWTASSSKIICQHTTCLWKAIATNSFFLRKQTIFTASSSHLCCCSSNFQDIVVIMFGFY